MFGKIFSGKKLKFVTLRFLTLLLLVPFLTTGLHNKAFALDCDACHPADCATARIPIVNGFIAHRQWIENQFLIGQFIPALQRMTDQLTAIGMQQVYTIGTFFDAKHQLETQQTFQELQFQAHKDYQPSESFCAFGTAVRSMAHTESASKAASVALSQRQMARHLGKRGMGGAEKQPEDKRNRWDQFTQLYCDPADNNWTDTANTGLTAACQNIAGRNGGANIPFNRRRINIDIDYTRLIENKRTLQLYGGAWPGQTDEVDILALGSNLFGHDIPTRTISKSTSGDEEIAHRYLALRSVMAKRSVAENSFNAIVGLKSQGSTTVVFPQTQQFLGRILADLGIPEDEVVEYLGLDTASSFTSPADADASYFAMLEILSKKIYQNPTFFANLYDTPANVKRKSAALQAIELMLDRAIYESQLRQEMATSVLLSSRLEKFVEEANKNLE